MWSRTVWSMSLGQKTSWTVSRNTLSSAQDVSRCKWLVPRQLHGLLHSYQTSSCQYLDDLKEPPAVTECSCCSQLVNMSRPPSLSVPMRACHSFIAMLQTTLLAIFMMLCNCNRSSSLHFSELKARLEPSLIWYLVVTEAKPVCWHPSVYGDDFVGHWNVR